MPVRGDLPALEQVLLRRAVEHLDQHAVHHALVVRRFTLRQLFEEQLHFQVGVRLVFAAPIGCAGSDAKQVIAEFLLPERDELLNHRSSLGMGVRFYSFRLHGVSLELADYKRSQ